AIVLRARRQYLARRRTRLGTPGTREIIQPLAQGRTDRLLTLLLNLTLHLGVRRQRIAGTATALGVVACIEGIDTHRTQHYPGESEENLAFAVQLGNLPVVSRHWPAWAWRHCHADRPAEPARPAVPHHVARQSVPTAGYPGHAATSRSAAWAPGEAVPHGCPSPSPRRTIRWPRPSADERPPAAAPLPLGRHASRPAPGDSNPSRLHPSGHRWHWPPASPLARARHAVPERPGWTPAAPDAARQTSIPAPRQWQYAPL